MSDGPRTQDPGFGTDPIYAIAYTSVLARALGDGDLDELLRSARRFNRHRQITGRLVVLEEDGRPVRFLQWFEGHSEDVLDCLERIVADPRHTDIDVFRQGRIPARRFGEWAMGRQDVGAPAFAEARVADEGAPGDREAPRRRPAGGEAA